MDRLGGHGTTPTGLRPFRTQRAWCAVASGGAVLLGLWGLAVAQPLLDLYGRNGELFVAAHQRAGAIVAFALTVTLVPPLLLTAVEAVALAVHRRAGRIVHAVLTAALGTVLAATLLRRADIDATLLVLLLAVTAGVGLAYGQERWRGLAVGLRYLAVGPLLFLAAFVFTSSSSRLIIDQSTTVEGATEIADPAPVVILQLDELPLASLLQPDLTINRARFPAFAQLADDATWYAGATSDASQTSLSVPSVMTGRVPDLRSLPIADDHPRSIFSLLGAEYSMTVNEEITSVCPDTLCGDTEPVPASLPSVLADAAVVFGHVSLPSSIRDQLPRVDQAWAGFLQDAPAVDRGSSSRTVSQPFGSDWADLEAFAAGPAGQGADLAEVIDGIGTGTRPSLTYVHVLLPHGPWLMTPTLQQHSEANPMWGMTTEGTWEDDPAAVRQGFQRHLLQLGYTDNLLGQLVQKMKDTGLWDEALFVVAADHGVAFRPGAPLREPTDETVHEIYNVPLFIKYPHQAAGERVTTNARLIDVLPTIVDVLGVETDWEFDGRSLRSDDVPAMEKPVAEAAFPDGVPAGLDGVRAAVDRDQGYLPYGLDWFSVAKIEPYGDLIGQPLGRLAIGDPSPMTFLTYHPVTAYDPGSAASPVLRAGLLHLAGGEPPNSALITINGVVAGVAVGFTRRGDDAIYSGVISPDFFTYGYNDLGLLIPDGNGSRLFHAATLVEASDP